MPSITFTNLTRAIEIGANCYCLDIAGKRIVLDSGMHPKHSGAASLPNFGLIPHDTVDAIVLSHAHQDHVGSLPVLMRHQPNAPVFMTQPTRVLSDQMLHNSVNVMGKTQHEEDGVPPQFTHREVDMDTKRWVAAPLHTRFDIHGERLGRETDEELSFEFFDAGHILGSAGTLIRADGVNVFYTGDIQFDEQTVMQGASFPEGGIDVLIIETTRGDRAQPEGFTRAGEEARLAAAIDAAFQRDAAILIPVFALGKTQELLAMFHEFRRQGILRSDTPIYIGGLSTKLTEIYDKFASSVPRQRSGLHLLDTVAPFTLAGRSADESPIRPRRIFALSSGMMTEKTLSNVYGRRFLPETNDSIFFIGYADPESPAGKLRAAKPGDYVQLDRDTPAQELRCPVESFNFSAHASRESIRAYVNKVRPRKVVLVHGDPPAVAWFKATLSADLPDSEILTPTPGVPLELA